MLDRHCWNEDGRPKVAYRNKRIAKKVLRVLMARGETGLGIYRCDRHEVRVYHIGHG